MGGGCVGGCGARVRESVTGVRKGRGGGGGEVNVRGRVAWLCCVEDVHCNENPNYVFPEKELRGLSLTDT
jgi:hypothetical protein